MRLGAPLLLSTVAVLASYLPARRSAQVDPLKALREELDIESRPKGSGELG